MAQKNLLFASDEQSTKAGKTIILEDGEKSYDIGRLVFLMEDSTGNLPFEEILKRSHQFKRSLTDVPVYGSTNSAIWLKFNIKNLTEERWYLELGTAHLNYVDLFYREAGSWRQLNSGINRSYKSKDIHTNELILPLQILPAKEQTFYLKVRSKTIMKLPLQISSLKRLYEQNHKADIAHGIYFGLIIALSLYNLFVFIFLRDKTYLYYVLYVVQVGIDIAYIRGYTHELFSELPPQVNQMNLFVSFTFIFLALFTDAFIDTRRNTPRLAMVNKVFILAGILCAVGTFLGFTLLAFKILLVMIPLMTFSVVLIALRTLKKGFKPAKIFIFGFLSFTIGTILFVLKDQGFLPVNFITESSIQIGSALETVIFSFALATKLSNMKKEKEVAKAIALKQSQNFSARFIELQEEERKRIASELHDGIGQSLSLIKNRIAMLKKNNPSVEVLEEIKNFVGDTIQEVRYISYKLKPFHLGLLDLTESLKNLAEESAEIYDSHIRFESADVDGLYSKNDQIIIYRILEYSIGSILKKNRVALLEVNITKDHYLQIALKAFLKESNKLIICEGVDLIAIRERINILGGKFQLQELQPDVSEATIIIPIK